MGGDGIPLPFPNDGSFLDRFKQMQSAAAAADSAAPLPSPSPSPAPSPLVAGGVKLAANNNKAKLAFSLSKKTRPVVNPLKLDEEESEEDKPDAERQTKKLKTSTKVEADLPPIAPSPSLEKIPSAPTDPEVKKVADKLAIFVAKNGRQFENITRQKNPGDTPFRFLFETDSSEYRYYEYRLAQEEENLSGSRAALNNQAVGSSSSASAASSYQSKSTSQQWTGYQTPASALFAGSDEPRWSHQDTKPAQPFSSADSVAMMEFYMKKAAEEELRRHPKYSKNEMPPPDSLNAAQKRGHHMGDYIPPEELEKFLDKCNDAYSNKQVREAAEKAKIQADNIGHRLLSKMGWKEGEGLGSGKGRAEPVQPGAVKLNNLGIGAEQPGEVTPDDDIYEQYKKRMMLGYRHRPNPLNNPRKAYY